MAKKKNKSGSSGKKYLSDKAYDTLQEISDLLEKDNFDTAYALLEPLLHKYPTNNEVWEERAHFYMVVGDVSEAWWSAYRALQYNRSNMQVLTNIIYLSADFYLQWATQYYIELYAENAVFLPPQFIRMKEGFDKLNEDFYEKNPDARGKKLADLALIDIARQLTSCAQIDEAMTVCRRAQKLFPNSPQVRQIMSILLMSQGKLDKAIDYLEETAPQFPDDIITLHLLSQFYHLYGNVASSEKIYQDLKLSQPKDVPEYVQRIQLLAVLHKLDDMLAIYQAYLAEYPDINIPNGILHFVATATALSGDIQKAKKMWKEMQDIGIATENLRDLDLHPSQQKGITYFELSFIMPPIWLEILSQSAKSSAQIKQRIDKIIKQSPYFEHLISILLQWGDAESREFATYISTYYPLPMVRDFALGTKGSDLQRLSALSSLIKQGSVSVDDLPEIMINGQLQQPELFKFKINYESTPEDLPKHIQRKIETCFNLLSDGDWDDAYDLIVELRETMPDNRTLMNFEVMALKGLEEYDEADEVLDEMVEKFPDYHFTRMDKARRLIKDKQYDEAQKWIEPVETRKEFHHSELRSYAITKIEWFMAHNEMDAARNWLHQLEALFPEFSDSLTTYHSKLSINSLLSIPIVKRLFGR